MEYYWVVFYFLDELSNQEIHTAFKDAGKDGFGCIRRMDVACCGGTLEQTHVETEGSQPAGFAGAKDLLIKVDLL